MHFPILSVISHNATVGSRLKRGGITIASCRYKLRKVDPQFSDEFVAVEVVDKDGTILCTVIVVYIPPCRSLYISQERECDMWEELTALTHRIHPACPLIIAGDFNTHICDLSLNVLVDGAYDGREVTPIKYTPNLDRTPHNYRSKLFVDYACEADLISLNGLDDFDKSFPPKFTFERHCHNSVQRSTIDYCLVRSSDVSLVYGFEVLDRHLGISDHLVLSVEIRLNARGRHGQRPRLTPSDQPRVCTDWNSLAQHIVGPLTSSFTSGQYDGTSVLLELTPGMVAQLRRTHSFQPQTTQCDPRSDSLRENLKESKAAYSNTGDQKVRKTLAARMRRTIRQLYVNEHLTSLQLLLRSKHQNMGGFWKMFKDQDSDNPLPFSVGEITEFFSQVMGGHVDSLSVDEATQRLFRSTVLKACHEPLTREELLVAIANIQTKSSSGPDRLPTELYKLLLYHQDFQSLVLSCFNDMLHSGTVPPEWLLSKLVTIPKRGKSVSLVNLRPTSIMAPPMRIFMKLVCGRIISYLPHDAHQFGFTGGKSYSEGLLTYAAAVETSLSKSNYCIAVFHDLKAAFDTVNHGALLKLLDLSMVPPPLCRIIKYVYSNSSCSVFANGEYGEPFRITKGVKQGDPASGELFIFYLSMLRFYVGAGRKAEVTLGGRPVFLLLYADDIVILSVSAEHAQLTINRVCEYIKALGLSLNVPKCAAMHISKTKARLQSLPTLLVDCSEIEKVTQFKYLGATVNNSNNYTLTRQANVPTASAASAMFLRGLTQKVTHAPVDMGMELFGTFVKSVASTGHVISSEWFPPGTSHLKKDMVNQVLTRCMKNLLGVRRTAPDCGVYHITGILPLTVQIAQMTASFYIKVARSSSDELEYCALRQILANRKLRGSLYRRFLQPVFGLEDSASVEESIAKICTFNQTDFFALARRQFFAAIHTMVNLSPKLDILAQILSANALPVWLSDGINFPVRHAHTMCRVLMSSFNLSIETGRWSTPAGRVPREDRNCRLCSLGIEDIHHFMKDCPVFDGPRQDLSSDLGEYGVNPTDLLSLLMHSLSTSHVPACLSFAKFFHKILSHPVLSKACL